MSLLSSEPSVRLTAHPSPLGQSPAPSPVSYSRPSSPVLRWSTESRGFWTDIRSLRWVVVPSAFFPSTPLTFAHLAQGSSLKLLLFVFVLWVNWELLAPLVAADAPNPFAPLLFISHRIPNTPEEDPRYQKGWYDLAFVAYYIVFWSFIRQSITLYFCRPLARWFGIRRETKLDRFGEQGYAVLYFAFTAIWGMVSAVRISPVQPVNNPISVLWRNCRLGGIAPSTSG